jgi:hypothetical protein
VVDNNPIQMPLPAISLWADSQRGAFVADWQSNETLDALKLKQGDTLGVELHWVKKASLGNGSFMEEVIWPPAANITLAIGVLDAAPKSGVFTLSYAGVATTILSYDASENEVEVALNALPGIIADGGVNVIKSSTTYRVNWNTAGIPSGTIAVSANNLTPSCSIGIGVALAGSLTATNSVQIHIKQAPVAVCTNWTTPVATTVVVTQIHAPAYDGDFRIWRMVITPPPKEGTFRLGGTMAPNGDVRWSAPINVNAVSATAIASAINLSVTEISANEFEIRQAQYTAGFIVVNGLTIYNVLAIQADGSGLIGFSTKYGTLNLNSLDTELLLAGQRDVDAYIEVEVEANGTRQTLVQQNCTIVNDLIDTDSYTLVEWGDVIPADSVVRYDTSQVLTTGQQTQARQNIGAIGTTEVAILQATDVSLSVRVATLEATGGLTTDQKDAIEQSNAPSATNVFVTNNVLSAGYAPLAHTHTTSSVTGLSDALLTKANVSHTHLISNITGLQLELNTLYADKANINHTQPISSITNLQATLNTLSAAVTNPLTANEKAAMVAASAPSSTNPFATINDLPAAIVSDFNPYTGNLTSVLYPYEVKIMIGGTEFAVPARII